MNRSGLIRKLDKLGRVSLPSEIRKGLNIREGDLVEFGVEDNRVYMLKYDTVCMVCGNDKDVQDLNILNPGKNPIIFKVCRGCMLKIKDNLEED